MPQKELLQSKRAIEKQIEIAAPADAVWKALTDVTELARWFPLEARVTPGESGRIFLSWGPACEGEASIDAWEPGKKLRWKERSPFAAAGEERYSFVEWTLETREGKTFLRLVQSGFESAAEWESEYHDSVNYGWGFMLANLRHYLEHHPGEPRLVSWPRRTVELPRAEAWKQLVSADGFPGLAALANVRSGERYRWQAGKEQLDGTVEFMLSPRGFCVRVQNLNDALLWLSIENPGGKSEVGFWLSAYGVPQEKVTEFGKQWAHMLEHVFPQGTTTL